MLKLSEREKMRKRRREKKTSFFFRVGLEDYVRRTPPIIIEQRDLRLCLRTRVNRCARVRITSKKR
jgi:hypothetical protein